MKKVLSIIAIVLFSLSFTACKKCITCSVTIFGVTTSDETCGKKSEIKDAKDDFNAACQVLGLSGSDCQCVDS